MLPLSPSLFPELFQEKHLPTHTGQAFMPPFHFCLVVVISTPVFPIFFSCSFIFPASCMLKPCRPIGACLCGSLWLLLLLRFTSLFFVGNYFSFFSLCKVLSLSLSVSPSLCVTGIANM